MPIPVKSIMPIFFNKDIETSKKIADATIKGGSKVIEMVNRGENAAEVFAELRKHITENHPDVFLAIGTILNAQQAKQFHELGADFIVSPFLIPEVGEYCKANKVHWIPGCFSPTEIFNAHSQGAYLVKVFPGDNISPSYIKAVKSVLPQVKLMVTGGVGPNATEIKEWFAAGADYIGMGSKLTKKEYVESGNFDAIAQLISNLYSDLNA